MNIDTNIAYASNQFKNNQVEKPSSAQAVSPADFEQQQTPITETIDAVKAPIYDNVEIDEQGFALLAKSKQQPENAIDSQPASTKQDSQKAEETETEKVEMTTTSSNDKSAARLAAILAKVSSGQNLTSNELSFLQENSPQDYSKAVEATKQKPAPQQTPQELQQNPAAQIMEMPTKQE